MDFVKKVCPTKILKNVYCQYYPRSVGGIVAVDMIRHFDRVLILVFETISSRKVDQRRYTKYG